MIYLLVSLLVGPAASAGDLRARLEQPGCEGYLHEITTLADQRHLRYRVQERAGQIFDGPGETYVTIDDVADLDPADIHLRERRIHLALVKIAQATPNQFATVPMGMLHWRLAIYAQGEDRPRREAVLVGDHLAFDRDQLRVTNGEFLIEIPYDDAVPAMTLELFARWAFERTHLPTSRLKGLRTPGFSPSSGHLYLFLDLKGDAEYRLRETLRLLKYVNEELRALS